MLRLDRVNLVGGTRVVTLQLCVQAPTLILNWSADLLRLSQDVIPSVFIFTSLQS